MSEACPLGNDEVWDAAMPDECQRCWLVRQNERQSHLISTTQDSDMRGGAYRMEHGIRRGRLTARRIITELMVYGWEEGGEYIRQNMREYGSEIDCLRED